MTKIKLFGAAITVGAMFGMVACGGGSGSSSENSRSTSGPITSFGSIYVNGVEYETNGASVYIEDDAASESDLRAGMMVTVRQDSNGNTISVEHDDDVEGIVNANNIPAGQMTGTMDVMGQTVTVTTETIFESHVASITDAGMIAPGNIVEVSGHSTGTGLITATRLEVKAVDLLTYLSTHPEGIELKGVVENHSANNSKFDIGSMTIDYSGAALSDLANGISDGIHVEVKSITGIVAGELIASSVEREDDGRIDHHGDEDDEYEIHGMVMAMDNTTITVDSQVVMINDQTEFEDGVRADIMVGAMVEVEGYFNAGGELIAEEVELEDQEATSEMTGTVASVTASAANVGMITLMDGTVIQVTAETIMHDDRDEGMMPDPQFNLEDLGANDYIEMYVFANGDGTYTATKIEREDMPVAAI
jgi:hypothetical protein